MQIEIHLRLVQINRQLTEVRNGVFNSVSNKIPIKISNNITEKI